MEETRKMEDWQKKFLLIKNGIHVQGNLSLLQISIDYDGREIPEWIKTVQLL